MFDIFYIENKPDIAANAIKVSSLEEAREKSRTRYLWVLDGANDYSDFDLLWEPVPWDAQYTHVWASQWQDNSGTYLLPKLGNNEVKYLDSVVTRKESAPIVFIDHGNTESPIVSYRLGERCVSKTRFMDSYLGTLRRIISRANSEYLWAVSSICDYSDFDFTWHPSEWQARMLHVFKTKGGDQFGDTFFVHVPTAKEQLDKAEILEWYNPINFVKDIEVPKLWNIPVIKHDNDTHTQVLSSLNFEGPYAILSTSINHAITVPKPNLWRTETRVIKPLSKSASTVLFPKSAIPWILGELYDYPYIDKSINDYLLDEPLDIVFLENGEAVADEHWEHLCSLGIRNNIHKVSGVNGRLNAYRECAARATTDWFFVAYAKLRVNSKFNWNWQPDRMQKPKHYIFNAYNPITNDTYGHMAMIAFNKNLVLEHDGQGLDFSLHQEHTVVPLLSGDAIYATAPWDAWRTAFREVLKLLASEDKGAEPRLEKWLAATEEWTKRGADDAQHFYKTEAKGNLEKQRLTYEWEWLARFFYMTYITY